MALLHLLDQRVNRAATSCSNCARGVAHGFVICASKSSRSRDHVLDYQPKYLRSKSSSLPALATEFWLIERQRIGPVIHALYRVTDPLFGQAGIDLDGDCYRLCQSRMGWRGMGRSSGDPVP